MLEFINLRVNYNHFPSLIADQYSLAKHLIAFVVLTGALFAVPGSAQEGRTSEPGEAAEAVAFFNRGQDLHEKGDLHGAIALYDKALEIVREFPEAEVQKGSAQYSLKKFEEAERSFRRALDFRPDWSLAQAKLGEVLVRRYRLQPGTQDPGTLLEEASKTLNKAIAIESSNYLAHVALAELRLISGAPDTTLRGSLEHLTRLSDGKMNVPAAVWSSRALIELELGLKEKAKVSLARALESDAANQNALFASGRLALEDGDTAQANTIASKLEKLSPVDEDIKMFRARIFLAEGNAEAAAAVMKSVAAPSAKALALLENISASAVDNAPQLEALLAKDPGNAAALGRLCTILRTGDPAKAVEYCRRAVEAEPSDVRHAVGFGAALVQAKRYDEAVAVFRKLLEFVPDNSSAHANLATAFFQLKRFEEAKTEFRWLIDKQPALAGAYYFLAVTHDQLQEYPDAMANYQLFLRYADAEKNSLEIEKVKLRMPSLDKQVKGNKGKRK